MSLDIELHISPGYVSAVYFIIFDIIVISSVDVVIARILSRYYYRSIYYGRVITLRSADIPGITTYLLDAFWSWPNIIARVVKLVCLACVLLVDIEINSAFSQPSYEIHRTARFQFNASQEAWGDSLEDRKFTTVGYTWQQIRDCHQHSDDSDEIRYYSVAFNLEYNITVDLDGTINAPPYAKDIASPDVLDNSTQCLAPGLVVDKFAVMTNHVVGCSNLNRSSSCSFEAPLEGRAEIGSETQISEPFLYKGSRLLYGTVFTLENVSLTGDWSKYKQPALTCIRFGMGITGSFSFYSQCLLISAVEDGNTLVELWYRDVLTGIFRRRYPGPVFKGALSIGKTKRIDTLVDLIPLWKSGERWDSLSSILVADSAIYKRDEKTITAYGKQKTVTTVPVYTLIILAAMVFITILSKFIIWCTSREDPKPQLNTIDGLSSIAREEVQPTGRSLVVGPTMVVGLKSTQRGIRLGPAQHKHDFASRDLLENADIY